MMDKGAGRRTSRRTVLAGMGAGVVSASMLSWNSAWAADEIPIGMLTPLTGAGGVDGPSMLKAAEAAVAEVNAARGPLGRQLGSSWRTTRRIPKRRFARRESSSMSIRCQLSSGPGRAA